MGSFIIIIFRIMKMLIVLIVFHLITFVLSIYSLISPTVTVHDFSIEFTRNFIFEVSTCLQEIAFDHPGDKFYIYSPSFNLSGNNYTVFKDRKDRFHRFYIFQLPSTKQTIYVFYFTLTSPFTTSKMFKSFLTDYPVKHLQMDDYGFFFSVPEREL